MEKYETYVTKMSNLRQKENIKKNLDTLEINKIDNLIVLQVAASFLNDCHL